MLGKVFISPHNDDESLFGAFTLTQHSYDVQVVVVFDSYVQVHRGRADCDRDTRRKETALALGELGVRVFPQFLGLDDSREYSVEQVKSALGPFAGYRAWLPAFEEGGHHQHNLVARASDGLFDEVGRYLTYTSTGKSVGRAVEPWQGAVARKLRALSCYRSQLDHPDCRPHFLRGIEEYLL